MLVSRTNSFGSSCSRYLAAGYALTYMDEFIDDLLTQERVCDVILPRLTKREVLEDTEGLKKRKSTLVSPVRSHLIHL